LFEFVPAFVDDGFEGGPQQFASLDEGEGLGVGDDFTVGGVDGGGFQFVVIGGGLFEKQFFSGVVVHGGSGEGGGKPNYKPPI
jgi:hypothetical protein